MLEMVDDILLQEFGSYAPQLESMENVRWPIELVSF